MCKTYLQTGLQCKLWKSNKWISSNPFNWKSMLFRRTGVLYLKCRNANTKSILFGCAYTYTLWSYSNKVTKHTTHQNFKNRFGSLAKQAHPGKCHTPQFAQSQYFSSGKTDYGSHKTGLQLPRSHLLLCIHLCPGLINFTAGLHILLSKLSYITHGGCVIIHNFFEQQLKNSCHRNGRIMNIQVITNILTPFFNQRT